MLHVLRGLPWLNKVIAEDCTFYGKGHTNDKCVILWTYYALGKGHTQDKRFYFFALKGNATLKITLFYLTDMSTQSTDQKEFLKYNTFLKKLFHCYDQLNRSIC